MITDGHPLLSLRRRATRLSLRAIVDRSQATSRSDRTDWLAAGLIAFTCVLHLAYLAIACPFDLAPDEAHYWHWSRHLDSAYYSKGPLIAWLIRASCELLGPLSVYLTGSEVFAVRLPAVACHAAVLAGVYVLTAETLRDRRFALVTLALALTVPPMTAGAVLMTIDAPFLACWTWSLVFLHRAITDGRTWNWLLAGGFCGLGLLAKFPMLLLPMSLVIYLLTDHQRRKQFHRPGLWIMLGIVGLASVPIVEWNLRHGWVEVRHVVHQVGGNGLNPLAPFAFLGGQFGFLIGYWFLAFLASAWSFRPPVADRGHAFLWHFSIPVWLVFLLASTRTEGQVNWPAAAYVAGFPLAVAWVLRQVRDPSQGYRRFATGCLVFAIALGSILTLMAHFPATLLRPILARLMDAPTPAHPLPLRKLDPTCRLQGWSTLGKGVDAIRARVRAQTGQDPLLAGMVWTIPGELSFYCEGHPEAYSFGLALADRHSQYDLWRPNPVADAQVFEGRTFLYVGEEIPGMTDVFDRVEAPIRVEYAQDGQVLAAWTIWIGHGFRGFREISHRADY